MKREAEPRAGLRDLLLASPRAKRSEMDFIPFEKSEVEQSIGARFAGQVRHHGHELSVNTRSEALTYDELDQASTRLAGAILAIRGVTPQPIGVLLDAGAEFVVALL